MNISSDRCHWCYGSGIVPGPSEYTIEHCTACDGTGITKPPSQFIFTKREVQILNSLMRYLKPDVIEFFPIAEEVINKIQKINESLT